MCSARKIGHFEHSKNSSPQTFRNSFKMETICKLSYYQTSSAAKARGQAEKKDHLIASLTQQHDQGSKCPVHDKKNQGRVFSEGIAGAKTTARHNETKPHGFRELHPAVLRGRERIKDCSPQDLGQRWHQELTVNHFECSYISENPHEATFDS